MGAMGVNCRENDDLDKWVPYELSYNNLVVVTVADELEHIEAMKRWNEYSVDIDQISIEKV